MKKEYRYVETLESLCKKSNRPHHLPKEHTVEELKWREDYKRRKPNGSLAFNYTAELFRNLKVTSTVIPIV